MICHHYKPSLLPIPSNFNSQHRVSIISVISTTDIVVLFILNSSRLQSWSVNNHLHSKVMILIILITIDTTITISVLTITITIVHVLCQSKLFADDLEKVCFRRPR